MLKDSMCAFYSQKELNRVRRCQGEFHYRNYSCNYFLNSQLLLQLPIKFGITVVLELLLFCTRNFAKFWVIIRVIGRENLVIAKDWVIFLMVYCTVQYINENSWSASLYFTLNL